MVFLTYHIAPLFSPVVFRQLTAIIWMHPGHVQIARSDWLRWNHNVVQAKAWYSRSRPSQIARVIQLLWKKIIVLSRDRLPQVIWMRYVKSLGIFSSIFDVPSLFTHSVLPLLSVIRVHRAVPQKSSLADTASRIRWNFASVYVWNSEILWRFGVIFWNFITKGVRGKYLKG